MKLGISIKIDVTKIDKSRLFKGEKGTYMDLTTFIDVHQPNENGEHGFISQSMTKEEREAKSYTPILGNVKVFYNEQSANAHQGGMYKARQAQQPAQPQQAPPENFDDDIPF